MSDSEPQVADVVLAPGRDRPSRARHPWIFSGSLRPLASPPEDGAEVRVLAADGSFICRGLWNARSQIHVRGYRWDDAPLDRDFWLAKIRAALALRTTLAAAGRTPAPEPAHDSAVRLVSSEGDSISGLTVDRYGEWLVVQFTALGLARRMDLLLDLLEQEVRPRGIMLRTEKGIGEEEGLELRDGLVRGEEPPEEGVKIVEDGLVFRVDLRTGQKTGFYLDQRDTRRRIAPFAAGRRVADVCCYSGGFSLALARAGATEVTGVDVSAAALVLAEANARENGMDDRVSFQKGDALVWLRGEAEAGRTYDLVVLDPPRFARSRRGIPAALQGYARLNEAAVRVLAPGGLLLTCSCSGRVSRDEFQAVIGTVAETTGRPLRILEVGGQAPDHPVSASVPEGSYLKTLLVEVG